MTTTDRTVMEWRASLGAEYLVPKRIPPLSVAELTLATSLAVDLAEGRTPGHAQRVCYIAMAMASALELDETEGAAIFYGALMHDLGVPFVAARLTQRLSLDEEKIFGQHPPHMFDKLMAMLPEREASSIDKLIDSHSQLGADCADDLKLPEGAVAAIRSHHEHWDGSGMPGALMGNSIPLAARIMALAHVSESVMSAQNSALSARNSVATVVAKMAGVQLDPELVDVFYRVVRADSFWLAYYDDGLSELMVESRPGESHKRSRRITMDFAHTFADVIDAKCGYAHGHSARCADLARKLAVRARLEDGHADLVWWAALMRDVGHLGVPSRIMAKSDILTIEEMQVMQQHPLHSRMVIECLPGMSDVATWVGMHHEWPDGKGYPESLHDAEIPLEAKIVSVVDVYSALTSDRPYRETLDRGTAIDIIDGASGSQLDSELVQLLREVV
ncbi:MAG: HD domain-containing protein [Dehalococcoidia bacterium]|nr:HD domain-containing protein [Dehalococcoidia bacterium]